MFFHALNMLSLIREINISAQRENIQEKKMPNYELNHVQCLIPIWSKLN